MKIIDLGVCVNNKDPENIGRIRCIRYGTYTGQVERAYQYKEWDDRDLFTANPLLPTNINFIPEIGQTVMLLNFNTDKENVNTVYVAGPFTTRHDFNGQTHEIQIEKTSYGLANLPGKNIIDENGEYIDPKSQGAFAKHTDYAIYGKHGSDVLFTQDGLQLRGGKLISKESANSVQRNNMLYRPIMAKKSAVLYLKKFPKTKEYIEEETEKISYSSSDLKYMIEYDINNFGNGLKTIKYYVYKITKQYENTYKTDNPSLSEIKLLDGYYKLINNDNTTTTPTIIKTATTANEVYVTIRNDLKTLHYKGLREYDLTFPSEDIHPFYFRPTLTSRTMILTEEQSIVRNTIFNNISINSTCGPQFGLSYQQSSTTPPSSIVKSNSASIKEKSGNIEQTFSALKSDKIYFLTTDNSNITSKPINFENLNKYELTQENYLQDIEPNTYSMIRGEVLLEFLRSMYEVLTTHVHNINSPYSKVTYNEHDRMNDLFKKLENDLLNKSIRIN